MKQRKVIVVAVFALIVLLLAGLAGCGKPADSSSSSSGGSSSDIVLGVTTDLGTIEGKDSLKAVQMAVDEINAAGGVDVGGTKHKFSIASIDTREASAGVPVNDALAAVQKLIDEKKPNAILVGNFRSEVLLAAMDVLAKDKIPYINSIAMSPDFETKMAKDPTKYKYFFRDCLDSAAMVKSLGSALGYIGKKFNYNKIYFVYQDVAWAKGTATGLQKWASSNGWTVVGSDAYPTGSSDFSSSVSKAKAGGAQLIVPVFDMPQSGVLLKQIKSMNLKAMVAGYISPASTGNAYNTFNGDVEGMVNFMNELGMIPLTSVQKSEDFYTNFGKKYGTDAQNNIAPHGPGPAYDSVYLMAAAIKAAGSLDPDKVVAELEKTSMDGVTGHLTFDKNHQVVYGEDPKTVCISGAFQWQNGKRVMVYPAADAQGDVKAPN